MISGLSLCRLIMNRWQFEQLIDALNGPDWWSIGITIVNAMIMAWLGISQYKLQKRQTELQQRQTEAQEYDIYRKLYILLSNANSQIDGFLNDLDKALWEPYYNMDKEFLKRKQTFIDKLMKDLRDSYIDYELKFSKEAFNKDGYLQILSLMSRIIQQTTISLEKDEVEIFRGVQTITSERGKEDEAYALHITLHFKENYLRNVLIQNLESFIELKRKVRCDDVVLDRIRTKCKID